MAKSKIKATSVKKSIKTNKKKKFSLKNLDFKKNWKKLSYMGLAGFLGVLSLGYSGYDYYQEKNASAAGYGLYLGGIPIPTLTSKGYVYTYACKTFVASSNRYQIRYTISNRTNLTVYGNIGLGGSGSASYVASSLSTKQFYFNAPYGATNFTGNVSAYYGSNGVGGSSGLVFNISNTPNC